MAVKLEFEKERNRAAALDGDRLAGECDVVMRESFWIITHTAVDPSYGGQGIAGKLVACVMDAASEAGVKVKPFCSYAAKQFAKNPGYAEMEDTSVITVYGMKSCPDCRYVDGQILEQEQISRSFRIVDIGENVRDLKTFIRLRDRSPVFDDSKKSGGIGIPCFVLEDGAVTLSPEEVGLKSAPAQEAADGAACRLDGSGC